MSAGLARTGIRQRSALAMAHMASALFVAAVSMTVKPDPLSHKVDECPFDFGELGDPNDPRMRMAAPLYPFGIVPCGSA
ncbi:hypothetical protein XI03_25115 [Bradyrhizobium sp. CCBAU 65884]|nr:hypothetical protein [Bradyrhizobium sp. CCBAU 65884]